MIKVETELGQSMKMGQFGGYAMKNLILLFTAALFAFSVMALSQTLPDPVQLVVNDIAQDILPGSKIRISETQKYRLDAANKASYK